MDGLPRYHYRPVSMYPVWLDNRGPSVTLYRRRRHWILGHRSSATCTVTLSSQPRRFPGKFRHCRRGYVLHELMMVDLVFEDGRIVIVRNCHFRFLKNCHFRFLRNCHFVVLRRLIRLNSRRSFLVDISIRKTHFFWKFRLVLIFV